MTTAAQRTAERDWRIIADCTLGAYVDSLRLGLDMSWERVARRIKNDTGGLIQPSPATLRRWYGP